MKRFRKVTKLLNSISFEHKTNFLIFLIASGMLSIIFLSQVSIFSLKHDFDTLYKKRTVPLVQLEAIKDIYNVNIYDTLFDLQQKTIKYPQAKEVISLSKQILEKNWQKYKNSLKNEKNPLFYFTYLANQYIDKESDKDFYILQNRIIENIDKKMVEIDKNIDKFFYLYRNDKNLKAKRLLKELYLNIGLNNIYLTNLINFDLKKADIEKRGTEKIFYLILAISIISIAVIFIISILFSLFIVDNFKELHSSLEEKVNEKTKELQKLNENLEKRIKKEVENSRKKDRIMYQQAKLASLGEMLQNIAHQWRQPLGSLSLIIQSFETKRLKGKLTDEFIEQKVNDGLKIAQNMSQTIEDFRNFFSPDKTRKYFTIKECIEHSLELSKYILQKKGIDVYLVPTKEMFIYSYFNELSHVFLNIIKNSEDALIKSEVEEKKIFIIIKRKGEFAIISFIDNGGGIDENIKHKIFEPYFTTKHKSSGTGIGLYMSKQIIEKHLNGFIRFENIKHRLGTKKFYECAMFEIKIPLQGKEK